MATSTKTYARILNFFIIVTLLVIAAITHFTLAKAEVTLPLETEVFTFDAPLEIQKSPATETLYGEVVGVTVDATATVAIGEKIINSEKAGAQVTLINNYSKAQPLVATTRLLSADGKLFRLTEGVTIPAGGSVTAQMEADQSGDEFIIPAGRFTIPGLWSGLQDSIYGTTQSATSFDKIQSAATSQSDIENAMEQLIDMGKSIAIQQLKSTLPEGVTIREDQLVGSILTSTLSAEEGDEVAELTATGTIEFKALLFDVALLEQVGREKLSDRLPTDSSIISFKDDTFTYEVTEINTEKETAVVDVHLEALVAQNMTSEILDVTALKGMTKQEAESYLSEQGYVDAEVTLSPFWVRHIPTLTDHIYIIPR